MSSNITFGESISLSILGFGIVFIVLLVLIVSICLLRYFINKYVKETPTADKTAEKPAAKAQAAAGGEAKSAGTDDRTAALIIGIVCEETKTPLDRLNILSVACISGVGVEAGKQYKYTFETREGLSDMTYKITVNDSVYEVTVEKGEAAVKSPVAAVSAAPASADADKLIKAPLAGSIMSVAVSPGESVTSGQVLLVLEALKMENEIVAPFDAVISQVRVSKGDAVNAGDLMITLA